MSTEALVGVGVTLALFLATQTGAFLVWASRINTRVDQLDEEINDPATGLRKSRHDHNGLLAAHTGTLENVSADVVEIKGDVKALLFNRRGAGHARQ